MFSFFKKRLHRQIYVTIVVSLLLVVAVTGAVFVLRDHNDPGDDLYGISTRLVFRSLPPATASPAEHSAAINDVAVGTNLRISLFDKNKTLIASYGKPIPSPKVRKSGHKWQRHRGTRGIGPVWVTQFSDGRWIAVDSRKLRNGNPILTLFIVLSGITLAIGLGAYPFVRKLTGRLERLQNTVTAVGDGDISRRAEIEGKDEVAELAGSFNETADKIESLINSNRQLLAHASHELRTPLARVRLGVEMVKNKPDPKRLTALEEDIAELDALIDEILLMSRLDTGAKLTNFETIDLTALAFEEAARYEKCTVSGEPVQIVGDVSLMRRVIRNLLDNAEKYGEPPIHLKVETGDQVILTITDQGQGIPADQKDAVFQPFHRAPGMQNIPGYGLGLALVKQIVQSHGGSVEIDNAKTSEFSVIIKLPQADKPG